MPPAIPAPRPGHASSATPASAQTRIERPAALAAGPRGGARPAALLGLVLLSSFLLPLSLPNEIFPYGNPALGPVAIAPVFIAVSLAPSFGFASVLGVVFGGLSTSLANYWLMFFQGYSIWTMGGTVIGYIGYNALLFPFLRGFARLGRDARMGADPRTGRDARIGSPAAASAGHPYRPFLLAMAWAVYEYLKSIGFLGYPWGLVAYPFGDFLPLAQFIDTTGIWGLSFLGAMVNAFVAEWVLFAIGPGQPIQAQRHILARQTIFASMLLAFALAYGLVRMAAPPGPRKTANLLLVQQNINPWELMGKASVDSATINEELTLEGLAASPFRPDLVVWSESSVPDTFVTLDNRFIPRNTGLVPFARKIGLPVLFGGVVVVDSRNDAYQNAAVLMSPEGSVVDSYAKMHPVPFAENIPFFEYEPVRWFFRNIVGVWNPWVMGTRRTIFRVSLASDGRALSFAAPICFEDAFSDLCRRFILDGADLWINLTNDYWSKTFSSEYQHFQVARFRAIENRRVLVRSTNGGVTAVVDPRGRILASLPLFERSYLPVQVPIETSELTIYTRLGDWFPRGLAAILFLLLVLDRLRGRAKRSSARS